MRAFLTILSTFSLGLVLGLQAVNLQAQCSDLFISEYVEGSANNKCIEVFNPTSSPIDLGAGQYALLIYANGSASVTTSVPLAGMIPAGGTYVICHSSANADFLALADQTSGGASWNGDDAIALVKDGTDIDIFGAIGFDPGTEWAVGDNHTRDRTLRRNADVTTGNLSNDPEFPALGTEWTEYPTDTYDGLGTHTFDGCPSASREEALATDEMLLEKVFPNPAVEYFTLSIAPELNGQIHVLLYNAEGVPVADYGYQNLLAGKRDFTFPLSRNLPSGIYFLQMVSSNGSFVRKIVIE